MNTSKNNSPKFVGREVELKELKKILHSDNPEFVCIYGRRRVGKTFLVKEAAQNNFSFYFTATYKITKQRQLDNFAIELKNQFNTSELPSFDNWFSAFNTLGNYLEKMSKTKNKIIFLDEIPWADSPKSNFLPALENFWNTRCAFNCDIKLVVCGSATSWIINKILYNRGGLYGRITHRFKIEPFDLYESSLYFKENGFHFKDIEIAEIYMAMGGIPFYFSLLDKSDSVARNLDKLFFSQKGELRNEFQYLYNSLYKHSEIYIKVVGELAKVGKGLTRQQLIERLKIIGNGSFSTVLKELEECGFIRCYLPLEEAVSKKTERIRSKALFQVIDLFSLFYLRFTKEIDYFEENFWTLNYNTPRLNTWKGLAFEKLCLWHIPQIKMALGISGVSTRVCSWIGKNEEGEKAQIDLLIERQDGVINVCEMKWSSDKFIITKSYAAELQKKIDIFYETTKTKKVLIITLITTKGIKLNTYYDYAQKQIELHQLFKY